MIYEIVVEGFVLDVEVTHCENEPPQPNTWASDWDFYGSRELEYKLVSGITYDDDGVRMDCTGADLSLAVLELDTAIRVALWAEIDAQQRRERWAA
jgi:hypothetical protein